MEVKIYTTPTCGYCDMAKRFLSERGVKYGEHDVSRDIAAAEEMVSLTGQRGVPVIVIDGQVILGFDRPRIEQLLAGNGRGQRIRFGLKVADAGKMAVKLGKIPVFGALVGAVVPGFYGERAGLKSGDIITGINTQRIRNASEMERMLAALSAGSNADISFIRNNQTLHARITL